MSDVVNRTKLFIQFVRLRLMLVFEIFILSQNVFANHQEAYLEQQLLELEFEVLFGKKIRSKIILLMTLG